MEIPAHLKLTIRELAPLIRAGAVSPVELVESHLGWIKQLDPTLNAFISVREQEAIAEAKASQRLLRRGEYLGPLHGVPMAVKDNIWVEGTRCTMGSKVMADFVPKRDAACVAKLRRAGAIIVGKTNTHEFASGVTSVNPHYGPVRNPWDTSRMSGGSSGGSAAAVSSCMSTAAIGTETTGSVRIPASLCGLVGLKSSLGRVSTYGVFPLAKSMDCVGALAKTTWDAAVVLNAMAGHDDRDSGTSGTPEPSDYAAASAKRTKKELKVGIPRDYFLDILDPEVRRSFFRFVEKLSSIGS